MAVISLKVVISLTVPFSILRCVPANSRVWNRYHIMTPVYVSVIYFCIRSLVRHPPNTSIGCFRLALLGEPRHWGQSECSSKTPHVTLLGRSYWIIHTHQIKIRQKKLRNLFTPSAIFFATKFHVFVIMSKATSEVFSSYQRKRTILSFRERYRLTILYQTYCDYDGTERGFTKCDLIVTKITKLLFSLSEQ